jgi:hypothetical protein
MPQRPFKTPREWPPGLGPLGLGLGIGALALVGGLGLRGPVLLGAVLPPLVASRIWWRRQRTLTETAIASGDLFDPWMLQQRLARLQARPGQGSAVPAGRWPAIGAELEGIRQLAARCAALDATSTVSLLLLLEGLLDRLQEADRPGAEASDLACHLALCRAHLACIHDEARLFALRHPGQPLLLPPLPARFLP